MEPTEQGTKPPRQSKRAVFFTFLRYLSVIMFTLGAAIFVLVSLPDDDFGSSLFLVFLAVTFKIAVPLAIIWIISAIMGFTRRTRIDRGLLWFHIVDLILLAAGLALCRRPERVCDRQIMTEFYIRNHQVLSKLKAQVSELIPDSTDLRFEFGAHATNSQPEILDSLAARDLEELLGQNGLRGVSVTKTVDPGYVEFLFRRVGMGAYYFRIYDRTLSPEEIAEADRYAGTIILNDSVTLEYGGGAFGSLDFPGKYD